MEFTGSLALVLLIMVVLAFTAVCLGTFLSIFADNEFQVVQFIPVVIIPQIFFSGIIPVDTFPFKLGLLSYIMPAYYACVGLENVIIKGYGLAEIKGPLLALVIFILVLSVLNTLALKKYRKI